ncbi:MAG: glycoside hydrolase family 25 protein [Prevotella sp.]
MKCFFTTIFTLFLLINNIHAQQFDYIQCEDTCDHIHGFDMSHYQGEVFWDAIGENAHLAYVYLKATEGGDRIDSYYAYNIELAHRHGIKVGSYHFFRPRTCLELQLRNFMTQCRPEQQDLIPMIDIETKGGLSDDAFLDSLTVFLDMVEKAYGQKPLIYTGTNFYNKYLLGMLTHYKVMIAQYTEHEPVLFDNKDITLWQYTGKGSIHGVNGHVDKSRFMGKHGLREIRFIHRTD